MYFILALFYGTTIRSDCVFTAATIIHLRSTDSNQLTEQFDSRLPRDLSLFHFSSHAQLAAVSRKDKLSGETAPRPMLSILLLFPLSLNSTEQYTS